MPRGIPKAGGAAAPNDDQSVWDGFAAAALTGFIQRGNQSSEQAASAAAHAADRLMEFRQARFGADDAPAEA